MDYGRGMDARSTRSRLSFFARVVRGMRGARGAGLAELAAVAILASIVGLGVTGCGDDGPVCTVPAQSPLPTTGELIHPDQLMTADACVAGGLADLPGRWFIRDLGQHFSFSYPLYDGTCADGLRGPDGAPDDLDDSDGSTWMWWTDGTRVFTRYWRKFEFGGGQFYEYGGASVLCMKSDGNLAWAWGGYDSDRGLRTGGGIGTRFAPMDEPARGLALVGALAERAPGQPIAGYNVVVDGTTAYVVGSGGLDIVDVSAPAAPRLLASRLGPQRDGFNDVRVVRGGGRVVAFASPLSGETTAVFDVTDPAAPVTLAALPEYSHSVQVRVDGARTLLYLANYENTVPIYDVTDPVHPLRIAAPVVPSPSAGIHDLTADGTMIYANDTTDGLVAIDVSAGLDQPAVERGRIQTTYSHASWAATIGGRKIVLHGDEGMTPEGGAFMRVLDGDPGSPTFLRELARWKTRADVGIHNIMVVGTKAYVSYYQDGVRIVELADPTHPREVAHYNTWDPATAAGDAFEGAVGVRVVGDLIYVADIGKGLVILRETP